MSMSLFPLFLKLQNQKCLVIGGGVIAEQKTRSLLESYADITIISPDLTPFLQLKVDEGMIYHQRRYQPGDLSGYFMVIAATNDTIVNNQIYLEARNNNQLINCVDDPQHCNFYLSSVIKKEDLQIAISTAGKSPLLAKALRKYIEALLPDNIGEELEKLHIIRQQIKKEIGNNEALKRQRMDELIQPLIDQLLNQKKRTCSDL